MNHARVVVEKLTDNSKVYNVEARSGDGPRVYFACRSRDVAQHLCDTLNDDVVDIAIKG